MPQLTVIWSEEWVWLGGSLLLAAVWANLAWFFRRPRSGTIGGFITRLIDWRFSPWLLQLLRLLYYVGVPFAALLWGHDAVVARLMGLHQLDLPIPDGEVLNTDIAANWLDWAYDVGWAATLSVGTWMLLALGWWTYRRALAIAGVGGAIPGADRSSWTFLREAAYHEVHWAFYRNAPILAIGTYWVVWIGLALVVLEAILNPAWHKSLVDPRWAPAQLMRGALAIVSSVLFLLTQSLWLALVLHWGVSWGLAVLVRVLPLSSAYGPDRALS